VVRAGPGPYDIEVDAGTVKEGTAAGLHFEIRGMVGERAVVVLEHVTRLADELAPEWPQPVGQGCYRVTVTGEPPSPWTSSSGERRRHNTAGLKATAMRIVNAVPAVVAGRRAAHRPRSPAAHRRGLAG